MVKHGQQNAVTKGVTVRWHKWKKGRKEIIEKRKWEGRGMGECSLWACYLTQAVGLRKGSLRNTQEIYRNPRNVSEKASVNRDCGGVHVDLHVQYAGVYVLCGERRCSRELFMPPGHKHTELLQQLCHVFFILLSFPCNFCFLEDLTLFW